LTAGGGCFGLGGLTAGGGGWIVVGGLTAGGGD